MVVEAPKLQKTLTVAIPHLLTELIDEAAQFSKEGSVKLVYKTADADAIDFFDIVNGSLPDLIGEDEKCVADPHGWDVELDGDLMEMTSDTPEECLRELLKLCYQVGILRLARENDFLESEMEELCEQLDQPEWDFVTLRERLREDLVEV